MSDRPKVSVVTPCYNTEAYLAQCLESVQRQTYPHFEHVIVDNASTDRSGEIARAHARRDSRVRLVRNETLLPQVENINYALSLIAPDTKYVKVVLSDDWIYPECLAQMVELAERDPRVGLVSSYYLDGNVLKGGGLPPERTVAPGTVVARLHLIDGHFMFGSPSTVLFRADIIRARTPFYTLGRLHEDTEACYDVLREWDFGFVHQVLSFARVDPRSISGAVSDFNPHILDRLIVLLRYGPTFLSPQEYERMRRRIERRYWGFLGENLLMGRPEAFWKHHERGLATVGQKLHGGKLYGAVARSAVRMVANPLHTAEQLWRKFRKRRRHDSERRPPAPR